MQQTRIESAIERACDVSTGFFISWLIYKYYIYDNVTVLAPTIVVGIFTVISLVRGYYWRRFFNKGLHKLVHKYVTEIYRIKLCMKK
jgi:membrane protein implicated in regulation of membrane protease activity